jgi:hypothetical protein
LKSSGLFGNQSGKKHSGILVNMTAKVSSISGKFFPQYKINASDNLILITILLLNGIDNQIGGWYSYRLSKTGINGKSRVK